MRTHIMQSVSIILLLVIGCTYAQRELESYNVDVSGISVSGLSAGACFATQMHVAYSSIFMGMGALAGVTYYCGEGDTVRALQCMNDNGVDPVFLANEARRFESEGTIDPLSNLDNTKVVILQGELDDTVVPACADSMYNFYKELMSEENIVEIRLSNLVHGYPTEDYGTPCHMVNRDEYINACDYHGAYEVLQEIYGGLEFYEFDQEEFYDDVGSISGISMASSGFVYVPSACVAGATCRLHVSLHGCQQGIGDLDDSYARNTFYNHVGELNNIIIIIHPQARRSLGLPYNPNGCYDWWGYNDGFGELGNYATHLGDQHVAIMSMIDKVSGGRLNLKVK